MNWMRSLMLPMAGSVHAREMDNFYIFLVLLTTFFFVLVAGLTVWSVVRYRRRPGVITPHITDNMGLELTWSVIPLLILMGVFFWGVRGFLGATVAPGNSLEITVTAKQWVWSFEYPDGTRTVNEVHVPVGKPVRFVMGSQDVLHSFFVPTMRVKQDVVPGRYTDVWFTPDVEGLHRVACAEYCGKGHSDMAAKIYVDSQEKYQHWLEEGGDEWKSLSPAAFGKLLYESKGCSTCHTVDGSRMAGGGPSWKGVFGRMEMMSDHKQYLADENYIRESILNPQAKIVMGYEPIMPTYQGLLRDRELNALIAYIKSLRN